jgi:hypothetical protein
MKIAVVFPPMLLGGRPLDLEDCGERNDGL